MADTDKGAKTGLNKAEREEGKATLRDSYERSAPPKEVIEISLKVDTEIIDKQKPGA